MTNLSVKFSDNTSDFHVHNASKFWISENMKDLHVYGDNMVYRGKNFNYLHLNLKTIKEISVNGKVVYFNHITTDFNLNKRYKGR